MVDETEIAWAAGFFDGEGCTRWLSCSSVGMSVVQCGTGEEPPHSLLRFFAAVGNRGSILREKGPAKPNWRQAWRWRCSAKDDVWHVLGLMWPYLSEEKLSQASAAMLKAGAHQRKPKPKRERCRRGHLFAETRVTTPNGSIHCTECRKITNKAWYRKEAANRARSSSV